MRKLNRSCGPSVDVMKSAEDRAGLYSSASSRNRRQRCLEIQAPVRRMMVVIVDELSQHLQEVSLGHDDDALSAQLLPDLLGAVDVEVLAIEGLI